MTRKLISVALALCMFATALVAMNVAGDDLTGTLKTKDAAGEDKAIYFGNETIHFQLTFDIDETPAEADFRVQLTDLTGYVYATIDISTNEYGVYNSWEPPILGLDPPGIIGSGKYLVEATLYNSGKTLFITEITVINQGIEFEPDRWVYAPGENVTMTITLYNDEDVNITIWPVNVSWNNRELTDNIVEVTWTIPDDIETGTQSIYVNESSDNSPIGWWMITISYFTFSMNADREIIPGWRWGTYMPSETASVEFRAYGVPDQNMIYADLIEFNMTFTDAVTLEMDWLNLTFDMTNATWFDFEIPDLAMITTLWGWPNDMYVDVKVYVGDYSLSDTIWIDLDTLTTTITTPSNPINVAPGGSTLVTVRAMTLNSPVPDADVTLMLEDGIGNIVGTPIDNLTTNIMGEASAQITVPDTVEPGTSLNLIAEISKLGHMDKDDETISVSSLWTMDVTTDKSEYLGGDTILVEIDIMENGVSQEPDYLEYWIVSTTGVYLSHIWTATETSLEVIAPEDIDARAIISIVAYLDDGEVILSQNSNEFTITTLVLTLSASKLQYNPGDTIKFEVYADGALAQFAFWYSIWDDDGIAIDDSESLILGEDGRDTFELEVPDDEPSTSYYVQVVADNGMGIVKMVDLTVNLLYTDYMIHVWIKTAPEYYQMNAYAPGQTLTVAFEIVPQRDSVPDLPYVTAGVTFNGWVLGEKKTFTEMSGELKVTIPENTATFIMYPVTVTIEDVGAGTQMISVSANSSGWDKTVGGLNAASWLMIALMIIVIIMLLLMMMRTWGGSAAAMAEAKPAEPKKEEGPKEYQPKASVACPNCNASIEVGTSKRPIEVMCPKCGTSQMVQ